MIQYNNLNINDKTSLIKPGDRVSLDKYCEMSPTSVFIPGKDYEIKTIKINDYFPLNTVIQLKGYTPVLGLGWATFTNETKNKVQERFEVEMQKRRNEGMTHERVMGWDSYKTFRKKLSQIENIAFKLEFGDPVRVSLDLQKQSNFKKEIKRISVLNKFGDTVVNMDSGLNLHPAWLIYPENYAEVIHNREIERKREREKKRNREKEKKRNRLII